MTSFRSLRSILFALTIGLTALSARAHDFWLEPATFRPKVGDDVAVRLMVGDYFVGKPYTRNPAHIERFVVSGPKGTQTVKGTVGRDPAGSFRVKTAGTYVLGYRSTRSRIELDGKKFEEYLLHEGLDWVVAERKKRGETDAVGTEVFSRCAKSIVRVKTQAGDTPVDADGYARALGFALELLPETAPHTLAPKGEMALRVVRDGKPVGGITVTAHDEPGSHDVVSGKTDKHGRVRLKLPRAGTWMVNSVHMARAPKGLDADWESLWASLTFEVRPAAKKQPAKEPAPSRSAE